MMANAKVFSLSNVALGATLLVGLYGALLGVLVTPYMQRFAIYAHKFNTLFYHDVNDPEQFGFARNQVTPFNIATSDHETLYAWHVLPDDVYAAHWQELRQMTGLVGPVEDFGATIHARLLKSAGSRVVVSFHGNAGHIAQGWRPDTMRLLASQPNTHVLTIDYRGFGHSTGTPTERGLIDDGIALVQWLLHEVRVPSEQIVIVGQSLGTAVASAVGLHFANPVDSFGLMPVSELQMNDGGQVTEPIAFAGIVLIAPFYSLPALLLTYRLGGLVPLLMPLRAIPYIAALVTSQIVDKWPTAERLALYDETWQKSYLSGGTMTKKQTTSLHLIHAVNDADISWRQSQLLCGRLIGAEKCSLLKDGEGFVQDGGEASVKKTVEILRYGGHNELANYAPVGLAVRRAFEG